MFGRHRIILVCCMTALVGGCASYHAEPMSPADSARALDSRTLYDERLQKFIAAELGQEGIPERTASWDLPRLTTAAIYYHPDLDIAHAKLTAAEAGIITAREHPNPVLNFTTIFSQAAVSGAIPPGAAPLTIGPVIDFILETFGKREYRTAQARHLTESARWDLATAGWQVRGHVRTALLNLWAAQQRLSLTQHKLDLQGQLVGLLERRLAEGEASSLDVSRERINRVQITLAMRDLERAEADARAQLAIAIGIPVRALDGVEFSLGGFDHPAPVSGDLAVGELRREALTKRSDVQASLQEYEADQSALQLAVANQYPNVTLSPGYNYDLGDNKYLLGASAELPIFHQNQGPIAQALAARQQGAASFTALQAQIIGTIDQAASSYRTAMRSLETGDALLADDQRRERQIETSFRAGQVDRPTLVTAQLEVAATALSRFDAVVQQRQALGALEDALQWPLFDPGRFPSVPVENPRLVDKGPSS
jgi:cobalt-zinc-cadmium efflux system outer membrane protein